MIRSCATFLMVAWLAGCGGAVDGEGEVLDGVNAQGLPCRGAPYPIVLAHGMAGWSQVNAWTYYYQVADDLRARGEKIYVGRVSPFDSSEVRGRQLAANIDEALRDSSACKVNIIAHSQGGIDARYVVSGLGYGDRVASVTTVSTPHRGTPIADVALGLVPGFSYGLINEVLKVYERIMGGDGMPNLKANLGQLTTRAMRDFNANHRDDSRVAYYSVAGRSSLQLGLSACQGALWSNNARTDLLNALFVLPSAVFSVYSPIPLVPETNDGLVTVDSAKWGRFLGCVPADHLDEIGQLFHGGTDLFSGFNHKDLYRRIATQLHQDHH